MTRFPSGEGAVEEMTGSSCALAVLAAILCDSDLPLADARAVYQSAWDKAVARIVAYCAAFPPDLDPLSFIKRIHKYGPELHALLTEARTVKPLPESAVPAPEPAEAGPSGVTPATPTE